MKKICILLAIVVFSITCVSIAKDNNKVYEVEAVATLNQFDNRIHFSSWQAEALNTRTYNNTLNIEVGEKVNVYVRYKLVDKGYDIVPEIVEVVKR